MKKILISVMLLAACLTVASAQEKEKEVKKGWSFGVLPTATYSVDNGFQCTIMETVPLIRILSTRSAGKAPTSRIAIACAFIWLMTPSILSPRCV